MSFDQPAWLILLMLLPLLGVGALVLARVRKKQWSAFAAPRLRSALLKRGSSLPRWFALLFLLAACGAIIAALARPQADAGTRTEKTLGRNVLIALDLSRSMRVADVKPDRLSQAKLVIYELLEAMPNERIGLIGFAGSSYVYAPLTVDHGAVRQTAEQIDETWTTMGGSDLAAALKLSIETLKKTGQKNNALVIISDGEKHNGDLDEMIVEAERSGVYILAIGVGTEDGDYVPNPDFPGNRMVDREGQPIISRLQPDVMRRLATETKGRYAVAGSGVDIPAIVKSSVKDLDAFEVEGRERKVSIEFYQWLLLPAIVFLLGSIIAATRWRGINPTATATLAMALLVLAPQPAKADAVSDARESLEKKNWSQAREQYRQLAEDSLIEDRKARFRLGEATAAYRGGDYREARSAFSHAIADGSQQVLENAHLGMGNTLFQLGWNSLAGESYPGNPDDAPDLGKFDILVKEQLAKLKEGEEDQASGYERFRTITRNWTDAVRHYESSLTANRSNTGASRNRATTITYLKRLRELLEEDKEETEQSMPQPQSGEGEPKKGEGEPGEESEDEGENEGTEPQPGEGGEGDEKEDKDGSGDKEDPDKGKSGDKEKKDEKDSDKGKGDPDESPEDRARRILKENADLEKGPLTPGRREFRDPEKDW